MSSRYALIGPVDPASDCNALEQLMIGESLAMREARMHLRFAAKARLPVLLSGPSGVGKSLAAQLLADLFKPAGQSIAHNCGTLADLFFNQEWRNIIGSNYPANDTLILEDIGDLVPAAQLGLLRQLDREKAAGYAGGPHIICTTQINLSEAISEGRFRTDLFFRLSAFPIPIAPLTARSEDLAKLIDHFTKEISSATMESPKFSNDALALLHAHSWPGNVRELRDLVSRILLLQPDLPISSDRLIKLMSAPIDLPKESKADHKPLPHNFNLKQYLYAEEHRYLVAALHQSDGVVANAARQLGMRRTTMIEKMKRHGIRR